MDRAPIDRATDAVMHALGCAEPVPPIAVLLLVREYASTGRGDIADALGPALGRALALCDTHDERGPRASWVQVFLESSSVSADERLGDAALRLAFGLASAWPSAGPMTETMEAIDACLAVAHPDLLSRAVDELERVIGLTYVPGEGVRSAPGSPDQPGQLVDHIRSAGVLLNAHGATGRLPYSMLAEELMQVARRRWWNASAGCFVEPATASGSSFTSNCDAARVLCRMSALHATDDYREAAVIAAGTDYAADAESVLTSIAPACASDADGAAYAVALGEYLALKR